MENVAFIVYVASMILVACLIAWVIIRKHKIEMAKVEGRKFKVRYLIDKLIKRFLTSKIYH